MSGPKHSDFYLNEQRRKEEEKKRERQIEEEKCRIITEQCKAFLHKMKELFKEISKVYEEGMSDLTKNKNLLLNPYPSELINTLFSNNRKKMDGLFPIVQGMASKSLSDHHLKLELQFLQMKSDLTEISENYTVLKDEIEKKLLHKREISFLKDGPGRKKEMKLFDLSETMKTGEKIELFSLSNELKSELNLYLNSCYLSTEKNDIQQLLTSIDKIMTDDKLDDVFKIDQLVVRKKTFEAIAPQYEDLIATRVAAHESFKLLNIDYQSICSLVKQEPKTISYSFENHQDCMDRIENEIREGNSQLQKINNNELISETIDEVMEELGYSVIAAEHISSPKREVEHHVYQFNNSNVINAFTSDNGSILFEVTGVKVNNDLSSMEKLKIKEGMDEFCDVYPKISRELENRGVTISLKTVFPADTKYARALNITNMKKQSKSKQQAKKIINKSMKQK